ncbi:MAG: DUF4382 domain-containing protein [Acidobacteriota bacterium]|nr:DUF4382 domain-containing protein [Acidobacteriota bacterium]
MRNHKIDQRSTLGILAVVLLSITPLLIHCGGGAKTTSSQTPMTGAITTSLSDPATCAAPNGPFAHVWVTVTKVTANISASAGPNDSGWVNLLDLSSAPKQIDLLSLASTTCLLTQLGSTTGLPPGNYQQIRIYLLPNSPSSGSAVPSSNQCGANSFNCVVLSTGATVPVQLSSQAQTGIKIPSGQIAGGGIQLAANEAADINVDFNTCESIVQEGNGQFRLKPTLHAGEVSVNNNAISGRVVDSSTKKPIAGALVFVEKPDSNNIDRIVEQTNTASDGSFIFCPLPADTYDVVVDAESVTSLGIPTTYNATVTFKVATGSAMGDIPLVPEATIVGGTTTTSSPATIEGQVTTSAMGSATSADINLSALQSVAPPGSGSPVLVTVPILSSMPSPPNLATAGAPSVRFAGSAGSCPSGADCENYLLTVPASNPQAGVFSSSPPTNYTAPAGSPVIYWVNAQAFIPMSGSAPDCSSASQPASFDSTNQLIVSPGKTTTQNLSFTGCAAGF